MKISNVVVLTVILVAFIFMGVFGSRTLLRQHAAASYPHVQGTVVLSTVITTHGSKGRVYYHPHITYRYTVNGLELTGNRYRYDGHPSDYASAYAIVNSHPPNSNLNVYYNPADPVDALLSPEVDAQDLLIFFLMGAVALFVLCALSNGIQNLDLPWSNRKATGGVQVITDMLVTRLRLPRFPPLSVAVFVTAILMISAAIVVGLGLLSTSPWVAGEWALAIVLISGVTVFTWQSLDVRSGRQDLVIDEAARTVQLPLTYGRREQTSVSLAQIRSIQLNPVKHQTKRGSYYTYMVTLEMADASQQKLINLNLARAESLGAWLRQKLGLPERTSEPRDESV